MVPRKVLFQAFYLLIDVVRSGGLEVTATHLPAQQLLINQPAQNCITVCLREVLNGSVRHEAFVIQFIIPVTLQDHSAVYVGNNPVQHFPGAHILRGEEE